MKAYLDITVLHSHEINQYFILQKVFQQLHLGFVEMQDDKGNVPIGISFPAYHAKGLGSKLRLLAVDDSVLEKFNAKQRLAKFSDYVHITGVRAVPERASSYAIYQRQQPRSASQFRRLVKRMSEREGVSIEEAEARITNFKQQQMRLPYINIYSVSSRQRFKLFIAKKATETSVYNGFSSYGLSNTSTVPEF